jgi:hypothetical protein
MLNPIFVGTVTAAVNPMGGIFHPRYSKKHSVLSYKNQSYRQRHRLGRALTRYNNVG